MKVYEHWFYVTRFVALFFLFGQSLWAQLMSESDWPDERFTLGGEALGRLEHWDWFGSMNDAYSFEWLRLRLNARAEAFDGRLTFFVQPQYVRMNGLPGDAAAAPPRGPSGMGGLYYLHNRESDPDSLGFHQAWIRVDRMAGVPLDATIGRFTHASGLEHMRKEDGMKFNKLKSMRLGDRMISSFEWSAFARSFDGGRLAYTPDSHLQVTGAWMYPTEGGWEKDFNNPMEDVRLAALVVTIPRGELLPGGELSLFGYQYEDTRACCQRVDNTGLAANNADISIGMAGGHWLGIHPLAGGQADTLLWGGAQSGPRESTGS